MCNIVNMGAIISVRAHTIQIGRKTAYVHFCLSVNSG